MNDLFQVTSPQAQGPTMSSREIAELVESRHDKVKQSIDRLVYAQIIAQPPMGDVQETGGNGRIYNTSVYLLTKRDTYVIVAQLSPAFTARLVDRWQALENAPPPATLTGPQLMAAALIEANTTMQAQALQIADMREDVDDLARLDAAEGDLTRREASKVLKYPEHKLGKWLELNRWAFRQSGKGPMQAYVEKRNIGYLTHKLGTFEHEGELKTSITMMITPKGMARLAKVLPVDARGVQP